MKPTAVTEMPKLKCSNAEVPELKCRSLQAENKVKAVRNISLLHAKVQGGQEEPTTSLRAYETSRRWNAHTSARSSQQRRALQALMQDEWISTWMQWLRLQGNTQVEGHCSTHTDTHTPEGEPLSLKLHLAPVGCHLHRSHTQRQEAAL